MDLRQLRTRLEQAFDRARVWLVPLAHIGWMSVPVGMVAWTNHVAASLTVSMDYGVFRQWMRDTGKSAWWILPFFFLPVAILAFAIFAKLQNPVVPTLLKLIAAGFYYWGVIEMSGVLRIPSRQAGPTAPQQGPTALSTQP